MRKAFAWVMLGLTLLWVGACSGEGGADTSTEPEPEPPRERSDAPEDYELPEIDWQPCPLMTISPDDGAECAFVVMPRDWYDHDDELLEMFVRRIPAEGEPLGQIWLLHGGPGSSGVQMESLIGLLREHLPGYDVYLPDHRGAGRSYPFQCPEQQEMNGSFLPGLPRESMQSCYERLDSIWGYGKEQLSITQAAHDVGWMIEALRRPEDRIFVVGRAAGTLWVQRLLQLFPEAYDGVVLEGPLSPTRTYLLDISPHHDRVGQALFELCAEDAFCRDKLGDDPWSVLEGVWEKMSEGHCAQLALYPGEEDTEVLINNTKGNLALFLEDDTLRSYLPALVHRLDRCTNQDIQVIWAFYGVVEEARVETYVPFMAPLNLMIHKSEVSVDFDVEVERGYEIAASQGLSTFAEAYHAQYWDLIPTYPADEYMGRWAETDVPMLSLHGELNALIPDEHVEANREHFVGEHQHHVLIEHASRRLLYLTDPPEIELSCGAQLLRDFVLDPRGEQGPLDTSCAQEQEPPSFEGTRFDQYLFGEDGDVWEN